MLPTPSTSHVNFDQIYEPAEDSFLFLDTLSSPSETAWLHERFPISSASPVICELGIGSGVILAFAAAHGEQIFGCSDLMALGVDANEYACRASAETVRRAIADAHEYGKAAGVLGGCIVGDLTASLKPGSVDVLLFNPPYVPTEELPDVSTDTSSIKLAFERDSHLLCLSYAGGVDGMEITNRFLEEVPDVLSERGVCYLLLCAQNKPEEVKAKIRQWPGSWSAETVGSSGRKAGWERLVIVRIWRP